MYVKSPQQQQQHGQQNNNSHNVSNVSRRTIWTGISSWICYSDLEMEPQSVYIKIID